MITDDTILRAKQSYLPDLFRKHNINLIATNNGSSFKCNCPFHKDSEPSLNLNYKDNLWLFHCFGCGVGGTSIDFKMKIDGIEFREAVERLVPNSELKINSKQLRIKNEELRIEDSDNEELRINSKQLRIKNEELKITDKELKIEEFLTTKSTKNTKIIEDSASDNLEFRIQNLELNRNDLLRLVVDHYHKILTSGTEDKAKSYLEKRCLFDDDIIKTFKIGFSNGNANEVFKEYRVQLKDELGIFKVNYYETFVNCIIFPVLDQDGNPTDIYARRTMNYTERASHCYNKGKHQGIFNIQNIIDADSVILTEGIIDALSIYKAGFKNVTALYGINGLIPALEELLKNKKKIIFAFDNDEAGKAGIKRYSILLKHAEVLTVNFPTYIKDMNELLCRSGISAVKEVIENANNSELKIVPGSSPSSFQDSPSGRDLSKASVKNEKLKIESSVSDNLEFKIQNLELISSDSDSEASIMLDAIKREAENSAPQSNAFFNVIESKETKETFINFLTDINYPKFEFKGLNLIFKSTVLTYEIRNVGKLKNLDSLRFIITANLISSDSDNSELHSSYTDRIDLYISRSRKIFENELAKQFNIQTAVIEKDLAAITVYIESNFKERKSQERKETQAYKMTDEEISEALEFLKSKNLINNIIDDISTLGYVGEDMNKLLLYLGATSRLLDKPISILIRSMSSTGKSFLIKLICDLMPPEDVHKWTSTTKQALYYMAPDALKHKFIAIDERHGIEEAEYPIRSLQSEGFLSLVVPLKNPTTGITTTEHIVKEGPIAYVDGSTDTRVNPENANRCFEIFLDETQEQTKKVHEQQKKAHSLEGMQKSERKESIKRIHKNAQRLLKPLKVVIPFIDLIEFPTDWIRTRRDHDRFLNLIVCIAFLHQYQRERKQLRIENEKLIINNENSDNSKSNIQNSKSEYIEATFEDYEIAFKIARAVLFNTFQELDKPVHDFYVQVNAMVDQNSKEVGLSPQEYWFTRRIIRQFIKLPDYLVKRYMRVLKDLEYFEVKSNGNGSTDKYSLIRQHNQKIDLIGLTTPEELKRKLKIKN